MLSRRGLLSGAAGLAPLLLPRPLWAAESAAPPPLRSGDERALFTLGVASGDPWPNSVVLWTRLAPDPIHDGGMPPLPVEVTWEVASDEQMRNIVRRGTALATPEFAHSLHVEAEGLEPGRWYWYRFRTPIEESVIGRTRTADAPGTMPERFRFAHCCCQDYSHGYYNAHRHMLDEDLQLVVFVGDYIYEGLPEDGHPRRHNDQDTTNLAEYRNRYGLYKSDPDLQANHAARPWVVTWDDHEVDNDYAATTASWDIDPKEFAVRRAGAYQAYYEHMPLRPSSLSNGRDLRLYRHMSFGGLIQLNVLDTRQYRDVQACRGDRSGTCIDYLSPARSILGRDQESWLYERFKESRARWNLIAQQVPMTKRAMPGTRGSMDKWDGYVASRKRLLGALSDYKTPNPIVVSGDIHQALVSELKADFDRPESATLGAEFVCTSISSGGDRQRNPEERNQQIAFHPHLKWGSGGRGYVSYEVTPRSCRIDYRTVEFVGRPGGSIATTQSFVLEDGRPGLHIA